MLQFLAGRFGLVGLAWTAILTSGANVTPPHTSCYLTLGVGRSGRVMETRLYLGGPPSGGGANIDLVSDDDRIRQLLERLPGDWRSWSEAADSGAVAPLGWEVIGWATDVVADFFGDDWFRRNLENFSHPLLSMYDHPLSNRIAAVRHIERAARIALLPEDVKGALSEGPNGIRRSTSSDEFDHMDIVLEMIGLARRHGWEVGFEVPTRAGRLPDVRAARSGFAYSIEVTAQGFDRNLRATRRQGDRLSGEQFRIEFGRAVECVTRVVRLLSDEEFSEYVSALDQAAAEVSESHRPTEFDLEFASASVYPKGERPGTTTHEGPMLDGDIGQGSLSASSRRQNRLWEAVEAGSVSTREAAFWLSRRHTTCR